MKGVSSIGHVALRVRDLDRSLAFYIGRLGFDEVIRLYFDDGRLMLVYLRVTDTQFVEIFPDGTDERAPGKETTGPNHFCLIVDDIEATVADLAAKDVSLSQPIKIGRDRNIQAWIEDPDGNRIELMQLVPDCLQNEALAKMKALT